jgi:hypothetical protein
MNDVRKPLRHDSEPDGPRHTLGLVEADPQFEKPIENFSKSL